MSTEEWSLKLNASKIPEMAAQPEATGGVAAGTRSDLETPASENQEAQESRETKLVQELSQLILTNKDFLFGVSANGRIRPGIGNSLGQKGYLLDPRTRSLKELHHEDAATLPDPIVYDDPANPVNLYKPLLKVAHAKLRSGDSFYQYQSAMRVDFVRNNPFTTDSRGPIDFQGSLFVRYTPDVANVMSKELLEIINEPNSSETRAVLWKFLVQSFETYTPEYWSFIKEQWQARPENRGKDIRDCFEKQ